MERGKSPLYYKIEFFSKKIELIGKNDPISENLEYYASRVEKFEKN